MQESRTVLIVGGGAREHALAWKIAESSLVARVVVAPGNAGWADRVAVAPTDVGAVVDVARRERADLVVVGPEAALEAGLVDALHAAGILAFGPTGAAARIETSKAFAKDLMRAAGVPTAEFSVAETPSEAKRIISEHFARTAEPVVVKADRLMAGKGVAVCQTAKEAVAFAESVGGVLVIENCVRGVEVSLHVLVDGTACAPLPLARDHKRLLDGDRGPNTGGMGAVAPVPLPGGLTVDALVEACVRPIAAALVEKGTPFRGVVFAGLMIDGATPYVLEYNARFGDPETEVLMPLIADDIVPHLLAPGRAAVRTHSRAAAAVVLAARGYPASPEKGHVIRGLDEAPEVTLFHAGTRWKGERVVTDGGRVMVVAATGAGPDEARARAYAGVARIAFDGAQYRRDIGGAS
jgi:phosphoribosylamine--glycine ligase